MESVSVFFKCKTLLKEQKTWAFRVLLPYPGCSLSTTISSLTILFLYHWVIEAFLEISLPPPPPNFSMPAIFCLLITAYKDQNPPPQISFQIATTSPKHHGSSLLLYLIALSSNKLQIKVLKVKISPHYFKNEHSTIFLIYTSWPKFP